MKLINLVFQGITARKETYDFGNKIVGCVALADANKDYLKEALSFAFYGDVEPAKYNLPLTVELKLAMEDTEYALERSLIREPSGATTEFAKLTDLNGKQVYAEGTKAVNAYVLDKISLDKQAFAKLFLIEREDVAPIGLDATSRESFVAERMSELTTSEAVMAKFNELRGCERTLLDHIDGIEPITRDEIKNQQLLVDTNRIALEDLRSAIEKVNTEIGLSNKYQEELGYYDEALAKMESLKAKNDAMQEMATKATKSNEAKAVASVFTSYQETQNKLVKMGKDLKEANDQLRELDKKVESGEASERLIGDEFVLAARRSEELQKAVREVVAEGTAAPKNLKIQHVIDSYYAEFDSKIASVSERKKAVDEQYEALNSACRVILSQKQAIRDKADYKKAVQDGAVIEGNIQRCEIFIKAAEDRIERLEKDRAELYDENFNIAKQIKVLSVDVKALDRDIRGGYPTQEEAINANVLYKQTLYSKHLRVSDNEVELDAVNKKIEAVKAANASYAEKLNILTARRDEIAKHRIKLAEKLELLSEKLTEYMSYNRLRDIAGEVEYGSHCPVCDGFVAYKKELPLRDTKALDDQIKAVKAELKKDEEALIRAESTIGQYQAAVTVSNQYMESLVSTKEGKEYAINSVLSEYKVADIAALFALTKQAVIDGNELQKKVDAFRTADAELKKLEEANAIIVKRIKEIDEEQLPVEKETLAELRAKLKEQSLEYDKLTSFFNGESAGELLLKLQVVEKEYETLEQEFEDKDAKLKQLAIEREELTATLTALNDRAVPVEVDGEEFSYRDIVAKAYSDFLLALYKEIDENEENKEVAKIRLSALKKVVQKARDDRDEKKQNIIALAAAIEATQTTASNIYAEYEKQFAELGVTSQEDIDKLVLDDATAENYQQILVKYDEDVVGTKEAINVYSAGIAAHAGYYEGYAANVAALAELKEKEEKAVMVLGNSMSVKDDMVKRYDELVSCNQKLAFLQARIKGIEDLSAAIKDGAIIAKDLAAIIFDRTNAIIKNVSKDRYYIEPSSDGTMILIIAGKGKVRYDKLSREERMLLPFGIAAAYNEVMLALLAADIMPAIAIGALESDKASLASVIEYTKEREIVAIPSDEVAFFRAISRIAV